MARREKRERDDGPGQRTRGRPRNPANDAAILAAACDILAAQGFDALTFEAVAQAAGVSRVSIYRRWPSKAHLLLSLYSASKQEVARPNTGSLRGDLIDYVGAMLARWRGDDGATATAPLLRLLIASGVATDAAVERPDGA